MVLGLCTEIQGGSLCHVSWTRFNRPKATTIHPVWQRVPGKCNYNAVVFVDGYARCVCGSTFIQPIHPSIYAAQPAIPLLCWSGWLLPACLRYQRTSDVHELYCVLRAAPINTIFVVAVIKTETTGTRHNPAAAGAADCSDQSMNWSSGGRWCPDETQSIESYLLLTFYTLIANNN